MNEGAVGGAVSDGCVEHRDCRGRREDGLAFAHGADVGRRDCLLREYHGPLHDLEGVQKRLRLGGVVL